MILFLFKCKVCEGVFIFFLGNEYASWIILLDDDYLSIGTYVGISTWSEIDGKG